MDKGQQAYVGGGARPGRGVGAIEPTDGSTAATRSQEWPAPPTPMNQAEQPRPEGGYLEAIHGPRPRAIEIRTVLNGWLVSVGCQSLVFERSEVMLTEIARYLASPVEVEQEYLAKRRG